MHPDVFKRRRTMLLFPLKGSIPGPTFQQPGRGGRGTWRWARCPLLSEEQRWGGGNGEAQSLCGAPGFYLAKETTRGANVVS